MLNPSLVEYRYQGVLETLSRDSGDRIHLTRVVEFLEVLIETRSRDLIIEYSPTLIVRLARILSRMKFTEMNAGIQDRVIPMLWSILIEYPEAGNSGIILAMLHNLSEASHQIDLDV